MRLSLGELDRLLPPMAARAAREATDADMWMPGPSLLKPVATPAVVPKRLLERVGEFPSTEGEKRSGQTFAVVMMCIAEGWSPGETLGLLLDYAHKPSLWKYGKNGLAGEVQRIYDKHPHIGLSCLLARCVAVTAPQTRAAAAPFAPDEPLIVTLARLLAVVDSFPWKGQVGRSSSALLEAHVAFAERAGSLHYDAGRRDLAELAKVNQKTSDAHRVRLEKAGWLKSHDNRRRRADSLSYTLLLTHLGPHSSKRQGRTPTRSCGPKTSSSRDDVFRYGRHGLGKTAGAIYAALAQAPRTRGEVVSELGCADSTARRLLTKMQSYGMVKESAGRWQALDVAWEALGDRLGTYGKTERQREQHQRERLEMRERERLLGRVRNGMRRRREEDDPVLVSARKAGEWKGWGVAMALARIEAEVMSAEGKATAKALAGPSRRNFPPVNGVAQSQPEKRAEPS